MPSPFPDLSVLASITPSDTFSVFKAACSPNGQTANIITYCDQYEKPVALGSSVLTSAREEVWENCSEQR